MGCLCSKDSTLEGPRQSVTHTAKSPPGPATGRSQAGARGTPTDVSAAKDSSGSRPHDSLSSIPSLSSAASSAR